MKEYEDILSYYITHDISVCTHFFKRGHVRDEQKARDFLDKYWLPREEYEKEWKSVQDRIFYGGNVTLPNMVFKDGFDLYAIPGGCLFTEEDFIKFKNCLIAKGEEEFVVVQQQFTSSDPVFYLKFPAAVTWNEMLSGDFISMILLGFSGEEYMIYAKQGNWARYTANDYEMPFDIYAFQKKDTELFVYTLALDRIDEKTVEKCLPEIYKQRLVKY